jgi:hypothetical protein
MMQPPVKRSPTWVLPVSALALTEVSLTHDLKQKPAREWSAEEVSTVLTIARSTRED